MTASLGDAVHLGTNQGVGPDAGSRRRHPSARRSGDHLAGPASRLASVLAFPPGPHPQVAAAMLAVRGSQARSLDRFAAAYGMSAAEAAAIERGEVGADRLPAPLRLLTPIPDLARQLGENRPRLRAVHPEQTSGYGPRTVSDKG